MKNLISRPYRLSPLTFLPLGLILMLGSTKVHAQQQAAEPTIVGGSSKTDCGSGLPCGTDVTIVYSDTTPNPTFHYIAGQQSAGFHCCSVIQKGSQYSLTWSLDANSDGSGEVSVYVTAPGYTPSPSLVEYY